ncbi:hypothetical protein BO85DRAFT_40374 [Aspergillus piperis CBS 112811]|uniref:Uncharacterized protein n=1 Tax=Aspergillus piperis CBS 112811 TaxID=1448313 RepID=A0A8G1R048_9EURO|nr:hypothetical protein BO85DRAFT_40374 [Aspergillus piperis CBS 112811]RAH56747.1 hypothetical protein BO85DRAFT_40374 [Aspergillus piperis CBS 112811]
MYIACGIGCVSWCIVLFASVCFLFFFGPFQGVHRLQCLRIALEVGVCNRCMVFVSGWNVIYVKHYFVKRPGFTTPFVSIPVGRTGWESTLPLMIDMLIISIIKLSC